MAFHWQEEIEEERAGGLLRDYMRGKLGISSRMLVDLKYKGEILLNGIPVTVRARLKPGDVLELYLPETEEPRLDPEELPLKVIYEDEDLLVVDKPAGMLVHPVPPEPTGTLAAAILAYWMKRGEKRPVRILSRLDRQTSGLVPVAKHALTQHRYRAEPQLLNKYYHALVEGRLQENRGLIKLPIAVNPANPATRIIAEDGLASATEYRMLGSNREMSLVHLRLHTGRTHQIRLHLAAIGHPIVGDRQYGKPSPFIERQALHASGLVFTQIRTKEMVCLSSPLPEDMLKLLW